MFENINRNSKENPDYFVLAVLNTCVLFEQTEEPVLSYDILAHSSRRPSHSLVNQILKKEKRKSEEN